MYCTSSNRTPRLGREPSDAAFPRTPEHLVYEKALSEGEAVLEEQYSMLLKEKFRKAFNRAAYGIEVLPDGSYASTPQRKQCSKLPTKAQWDQLLNYLLL